MPRNDNHYINLALPVFAFQFLQRAIDYLPSTEDRAIWELKYAQRRVEIDVSYHSKILRDGTIGYGRRLEYRRAKAKSSI